MYSIFIPLPVAVIPSTDKSTITSLADALVRNKHTSIDFPSVTQLLETCSTTSVAVIKIRNTVKWTQTVGTNYATQKPKILLNYQT